MVHDKHGFHARRYSYVEMTGRRSYVVPRPSSLGISGKFLLAWFELSFILAVHAGPDITARAQIVLRCPESRVT